MEEQIILIGYGIDLLNLSLLADNIYDTSNESIACKCIFYEVGNILGFSRIPD